MQSPSQFVLAPVKSVLSEDPQVAHVLTAYERCIEALKGKNPSILVFDCDWTLYPYDCDKHRIGPFDWSICYGVTDYYGRASNSYTDVPSIFGAIIDSKIPVAFLSRNPSSSQLGQLLSVIPCISKGGVVVNFLSDAMPSENYFHAYSSNGVGKGKDKHFAALKAASGVPFKDMIFFDDLPENIQAANDQGTNAVLLGKKGLTVEAFEDGLKSWRERSV
jgi:hypothetical protein